MIKLLFQTAILVLLISEIPFTPTNLFRCKYNRIYLIRHLRRTRRKKCRIRQITNAANRKNFIRAALIFFNMVALRRGIFYGNEVQIYHLMVETAVVQ